MSKNAPPLLGRLAVHHRMIDMDQLAQATREQAARSDGTGLGHILVELGFLDEAQLAKLVHAQSEMVARHRAKQAAAAAAPGLEEVNARRPAASRDPRAEPTEPPPPEPGRPARAPAVERAPSPEPVAAPAPAARSSASAAPAPAAPAPAAAARAAPEPKAPSRAARPPSDAAEAEPTLNLRCEEPTEADRGELDEMLEEGVERGASDIHLHSGARPLFRIHGVLTEGRADPLDASRAGRLALSVLTADQRAEFVRCGELDLCYTLPGVGRFRANLFCQQRGVDGVFRYIRPRPPSLDDLGLPVALARLVNFHQGMVLVTGPTGCGKSSTLAALVDLVNEERQEHILTIEDPIEYLHESKRCLVNQRSVNRHTESFARALRGALREDPDVIVIGELRDLETISLAMSAAETGHLVLATLHTNNAIRTVNRLIGAFPADQQGQIRAMISESLRAVISQRLIPRADGNGRVAAIETLVVNRAVGNLIRENKTFQIHSILQTGASQGMGLLDHSIRQHLETGAITREEALRHCDDAKALGG